MSITAWLLLALGVLGFLAYRHLLRHLEFLAGRTQALETRTEISKVKTAMDEGKDKLDTMVRLPPPEPVAPAFSYSGESLSPTRMMAGRHDAGLLVECLQNLIPAWANVPRNDAGLVEIVYGRDLHHDWYGGELKRLLARAGESPMHLPELVTLLSSTRPGDHGPEFTPRRALATLISWEGALWEEDKRLREMETNLRNAKGLWRREDLFVLWQLLRSVSPAAIAQREKHRQRLVAAQWEFAEALDSRDPALGAAYRQCRDAYHEVKEVFEWIDRTEALRGERYNPERVWASYEDSRHYHRYLSYHFFHQPLVWMIVWEGWIDPAHKDWVENGFYRDTWENEFARELERGRPAPDS